MKPWVFLLAALFIVGAVVATSIEKFQPEFLDRTQIAKTIAVEDSSYDQRTNHMDPAPYSTKPIPGVQTAIQVNQYSSYMV